MKTHLLSFACSAFLFCSQGVFAGQTDSVLLQTTTGGGLMSPEMFSRGIKIYTSGKVMGFNENKRAEIETELGTLTPSVIANLQKEIATLPMGEKIEFPDTPMCYDAPTTTYEAKVAGETLNFAQISACRTGYIPNAYAATQLKKILDGFEIMFNLNL